MMSYDHLNRQPFSALIGKTLTAVRGEIDGDEIEFLCSDGSIYVMRHSQDCCERQFAKPRKNERLLATWSVRQVRRWGGVLEHPVASLLWPKAGLPAPGMMDKYGGWTLPIHQHWWGHRAEKATLLYIVGCKPGQIPAIPFRLDKPTHVVQSRKKDSLPHISKAEREHTPLALAKWLVEPALLCKNPFNPNKHLHEQLSI